jgi:hypothetical protein
MVLSDEEFKDKLVSAMGLKDTAVYRQELIASHRALHSQVRELEKAVDFHTCSQSCTQDELHAAQARITALSHENAELTARTSQLEAERDAAKAIADKYDLMGIEWDEEEFQERGKRITQLEGALKPFVDTYRVMYNVDQIYPTSHEDQLRLEQELLSAFMKAQHALTPGVYKEWCRDPKLCQDKGTCPKDPTCAD